jgi:hypothetical protein
MAEGLITWRGELDTFRISENRISENRISENRISENRISENRISENRIYHYLVGNLTYK